MSASTCFGQALRPVNHPVTMTMLAILVLCSVASAARLGAHEALALIWNHTFMTQFYVWNVLSSSFVETSFVKLLLSFMGILGMSPAAEESLGNLGLAVFIVVVAIGSGMVTSAGIFFAYIITRDEYLLDLEVHGSFGVLAALGVAIAQHEPGGAFLPRGMAPWFPKRYFPLTLVTISMACRAVDLPDASYDFPFVVVGPFVAWVHLRFLAHILHGELAGDVNDEFQLVMFFPPFARRFLKPVCDFTYGVFLLLGFFKERAARVPLPAVDGQGGIDPSFVTILPTPERKDPIAERRRARAMKLLDEKFAKLNAKPLDRWEDDELTAVSPAAANGGESGPSAPRGVASLSLSQAENGGIAAPLGGADDDDWGMGTVERTENDTANGDVSSTPSESNR